MKNINVTLNLTRNVEANVTILTPPNQSSYARGNLFYLNATVQILGGTGNFCNATVNFTNSSVIDVQSDTSIHQLGSLSVHQVVQTNWTLSAVSVGTSNNSVTEECADKGIALENRGISRVSDLNVTDASTPNVTIMYPVNNTLNISSNTLAFYYNVTDGVDITLCELLVNGISNGTNSSAVVRNLTQSITAQVDNGVYNWTVRCTNSYNTMGNGSTFNLSIQAHAPIIEFALVQSPVDLEAGTSKRITCNASVTDLNGFANITGANATLFHSSSSQFASNDNNNHYTNSSCSNTSSGLDRKNFTCTFNVLYYANNDSWTCNITANDYAGLQNYTFNASAINRLLAIGANSTIDYGTLQPGGTPSDDVNLTLYNFGNSGINVSLDGFGNSDGDGLAMSCFFGSINLSYERYSVYPGTAYDSMINLTDSAALVANFSLYQRTDDNIHGNASNFTYWKVSAPTGTRSPCTGTVVVSLNVN